MSLLEVDNLETAYGTSQVLFGISFSVNQGEAVSRMFLRAGFGRVEVLKDLGGLDRVVLCSHS